MPWCQNSQIPHYHLCVGWISGWWWVQRHMLSMKWSWVTWSVCLGTYPIMLIGLETKQGRSSSIYWTMSLMGFRAKFIARYNIKSNTYWKLKFYKHSNVQTAIKTIVLPDVFKLFVWHWELTIMESLCFASFFHLMGVGPRPIKFCRFRNCWLKIL